MIKFMNSFRTFENHRDITYIYSESGLEKQMQNKKWRQDWSQYQSLHWSLQSGHLRLHFEPPMMHGFWLYQSQHQYLQSANPWLRFETPKSWKFWLWLYWTIRASQPSNYICILSYQNIIKKSYVIFAMSTLIGAK